MKRVTKRFFLVATLAAAAILATQCERRPLVDAGNTHYVRVYLDEEIKNVTTGFYDPSLPTPEYATPDVLRVVLYDQTNNRTAAERYLRNRSTDARGTYFDGYIIAEPGDYRLLTYNFGTESTVIDQSHIYHGAMAYTNEISSVLKNSLSVRADDEERIVYVPDHLFVDHNETDQGIPGIEEIPVLEVVDHHRIAFRPTPEPIMRPMPRLETMPWAVATSQRPAALPPVMMPKLPTSAPRNQNATAKPPTRKPTESICGEL